MRKSALVVAFVKVMAIAFQLLVFVLLARTSDAATVGLFGFANSIWVLTRALAPLGFDIFLLRESSVHFVKNQFREIIKLCRAAITVTLTASLMAMLCFVILDLTILKWYGTADLIAVVLLSVSSAIMGLQTIMFRACNDVSIGQTIDSFFTQILPGILGVTYLAVVENPSVTVVFSFFCLTTVLGVIVSALTFTRRFNFFSFSGWIPCPVDKKNLGGAVELWFPQLLTSTNSRLVSVVGGPILGQAKLAVIETGIRMQFVSSTISWVSGTLVSPLYARANSENDSKLLKNALSASAWASFLPSVLLLAVMVFFADPLLGILGQFFTDNKYAIILLTLAGVFDAVSSAAGYFFAMTHLHKQYFVILLVQLTVALLGILSLSPSYSALGAAIAVALASFIRLGSSIWVTNRKLGGFIINFAGLKLLMRIRT